MHGLEFDVAHLLDDLGKRAAPFTVLVLLLLPPPPCELFEVLIEVFRLARQVGR